MSPFRYKKPDRKERGERTRKQVHGPRRNGRLTSLGGVEITENSFTQPCAL
jgi:hypothetical protein